MSASGDWEGTSSRAHQEGTSSRAYQALKDIPSRAYQGGKECLPELIKTVDRGLTVYTLYLTVVRFAKSHVCQHLVHHQKTRQLSDQGRAHDGATFYGSKSPRTFCLYAVMNAISHIVISTRSHSQHQCQALQQTVARRQLGPLLRGCYGHRQSVPRRRRLMTSAVLSLLRLVAL